MPGCCLDAMPVSLQSHQFTSEPFCGPRTPEVQWPVRNNKKKERDKTKKKGVLKSMFDLTHFGLSRLFTRRILLINAVDGARKQKKADYFVVLLRPERRQNSSKTDPKPVKVCFCSAETKDFLHLTIVHQFPVAFLQISFKKTLFSLHVSIVRCPHYPQLVSGKSADLSVNPRVSSTEPAC